MSSAHAIWNRPPRELGEREFPRFALIALCALLLAGWSAFAGVVHSSPEALWSVVIAGLCLLIFVQSLFSLLLACCTFLVLMPVQIANVWPLFGGLHANQRFHPYHFACICLIIGASFNLLTRAQGAPLRIRRPLLLLFLFAAASMVWMPVPNEGAISLFWLFSSLALYHVFYNAARDRRSLYRLINTWIAVMLVASLIGVVTVWVDYFVIHWFTYDKWWKVLIVNRRLQGGTAGGIVFPTELSFFCYLSFFWVVARFFHKPNLRDVLLAFIFVLTERLTEKRMGQAAMVGGLTVFLLYDPALRRRIVRFALPIVLLFSLAFVAANFISGRWDFQRYARAFSVSATDKGLGLASRIETYKLNLKRNAESYFCMGMGIGGNTLICPVYEHSLYFSVFSDLGPVGAVLLFFFLGRETLRLMRLTRRLADRGLQLLGVAFVSSIAGLAFHGLLDLHYYAFSELWVYAGLLSAFIQIAGREPAAPQPHPGLEETPA